jgi:L-asparaginase / beta-aspartyl-peptidase
VTAPPDRSTTVILVHGGAGWRDNAARLPDAVSACERAAETGQQILLSGGNALDAVEQAVRVLEDAPCLNAGRGSYANTAGTVEMDALIMDGGTLALGAVAGITRLLHPVSLARHVMMDTPHTLLIGEGASRFADQVGFPRCDPADLIVAGGRSTPPGDTVGAVALDANGNLATATSTGGIPSKMPGRVGDSPLVGCGAYADDAAAAVAATGDGEALMKLVISKHVADRVGDGIDPQQACEAAIELLHNRLGAIGGLIALDRTGRIGVAFNPAAMPYARANGADAITSGSRRA